MGPTNVFRVCECRTGFWKFPCGFWCVSSLRICRALQTKFKSCFPSIPFLHHHATQIFGIHSLMDRLPDICYDRMKDAGCHNRETVSAKIEIRVIPLLVEIMPMELDQQIVTMRTRKSCRINTRIIRIQYRKAA